MENEKIETKFKVGDIVRYNNASCTTVAIKKPIKIKTNNYGK